MLHVLWLSLLSFVLVLFRAAVSAIVSLVLVLFRAAVSAIVSLAVLLTVYFVQLLSLFLQI